MSLNLQDIINKYLQLMGDLMVVGESTVAMLSDTGAGAYMGTPYLEDIMDEPSKSRALNKD